MEIEREREEQRERERGSDVQENARPVNALLSHGCGV